MGCCWSYCCEDPGEKSLILAEFDPLMTRSIIENTNGSVNSVNADQLIECMERLMTDEDQNTDTLSAPPTLSMLRNMTTSQFVAPILFKAEYVNVDPTK